MTIQCLSPFRSQIGLNESEFIIYDPSGDISYDKEQ
jgi:hypothetical protein